MKKLFTLFAAALVMLAAASCEKNEVLPDNNTEGKVITLKATINNGETKTSLGEKGTDGTYPVLWSAGDEIAVIQIGDITLNQVNTFRLSTGAETTSATFTCENAVDFDPSKDYLAVYPASAVDIFNGSFKGFNFSSTQTYKQNSFGDGVMPMLAYKGENSVLNFTNAFGILKLQLKGAVDEKVNSIEITSDKPLNGKALHTSVEITLVEDSDENKKLTLDCGAEGVALKTNDATDFLISIPPGEHNFTITVNSTIGDIPKAYNLTTTQTIEAGVIKKMAVMDFNIAYIDETGAYRGDGIALPAGDGKTIIWAPVNCGYEPANDDYEGYPYGKLYQWGRKYGQGYNDGTLADATYPSGENLVTTDPVDVNDGMLEENKDKFYYNWLKTPPQSNLWNRGTEGAPVKTEYDPCPEGWRVPTESEFFMLVENVEYNSMLQVTPDQWDSEKKGMWFYGCTDKTDGNKVFLPAAGRCYREYENIQNYTTVGRGVFGCYWSSSYSQSLGGIVLQEGLGDEQNFANTTYSRYSNGAYVRCIKE